MGVWSSVQPFSRGPRPVLLDCQRLRSYTEQTVALYVICWVCRNFGTMTLVQSMDVCKHKSCTASRGVCVRLWCHECGGASRLLLNTAHKCDNTTYASVSKGYLKTVCVCDFMFSPCHLIYETSMFVLCLFVCLYMPMCLYKHMCLCVIVCMLLCTFCEAPQSVRICGVYQPWWTKNEDTKI